VLQESIRIAQESNDHICLAHGLRLLYKLMQDGDSQAKHILERFRARASELKLPVSDKLEFTSHQSQNIRQDRNVLIFNFFYSYKYLESLSLLMKTSQMIFEGETPPRYRILFSNC
jgi:ADP-dependent phosphofructokinase/glucokinase